MTTPVIFRKDSKTGEIVAFFPAMIGSMSPATMGSYIHVGQHGSAHMDYYRDSTVAAKPEEYEDLLSELRGIYDDLEIKHRMHRWYYTSRYSQLYPES